MHTVQIIQGWQLLKMMNLGIKQWQQISFNQEKDTFELAAFYTDLPTLTLNNLSSKNLAYMRSTS